MGTFFTEVQPYTRVSATVLRDLGVQPTARGAAEILITLEGRTLHTLCLFGEPNDLEVLGAYTLEGFGLVLYGAGVLS